MQKMWTWRRRLATVAVPALGAIGVSLVWAALPPDLTTVILSEPSNPSSASSYSTARYDGMQVAGAAGSALVGEVDLNADGYLDLAVGAPGTASGRGSVYVVYGTAQAPAGTRSLSQAVEITGLAAGDGFGQSLLAADLSGDGLPELVVGAPGVGGIGAVYIIPGGAGLSGPLSVSAVTGVKTINGEGNLGRFGTSLAAGDVTAEGSANTDGKLELLIGAPGVSRAFLVYGPVAGGTVSSASSTNTYNFSFYGLNEDSIGASVAIVGDMNANGTNDFIIGGPHLDATKTTGNVSGIVYMIDGRSKQSLTSYGVSAVWNLNLILSKKRAVIGDVLYGSTRVGQLGASLAAVGDVNGDGFNDLAMGMPTASKTTTTNPESGRIYVVSGSATVFDTSSTLLSSSGFYYAVGETAYDRLGASVVGLGDIDGDGFPDLMAGAPAADLASSAPAEAYGAAYLLPGRKGSEWVIGQVVSTPPVVKFAGKYKDDRVGWAMAPGGRQPGISVRDFYIGAPGFDGSPSGNDGRVYYLAFSQFYDHDGDQQSLANADCNESDPSIYYTANGVNELCDGKDNDCDGLIDDEDSWVADQRVYYLDADGDGFGNEPLHTCAPEAPVGYVVTAGDCNDADMDISPMGIEVCDTQDNDCDGLIDDDDPSVADQNQYYADQDLDGYGSTVGGYVMTCSIDVPEGYSPTDNDCNDEIPELNPGVTELCDGVDNNCDSLVDNDPADGMLYFMDSDGDMHGDPNAPLHFCEPVPGYVELADDCDDKSAISYPGAVELCDNLDNNCDAVLDTEVEAFDADADGYLDANQCAAYSQATARPLDCNDLDPAVNPGVKEITDNGVDDDCDGKIDEASGCSGRLDAPLGTTGGTGLGLLGTVILAGLGLSIRRRRA